MTGSLSDNLLFTRPNLEQWLKGQNQNAPNSGYSPLTRTILGFGGGVPDLDSEFQWQQRSPLTVTSYSQCFDSMLENQGFKQYIEAQSESMAAFWEDFDSKSTWEFFRDVEEKYGCSGVCYKPLFFLTKDIAEGQPPNECVKEIIDDVYEQSRTMLLGMGIALGVIGIL